MGVRDLRKQNLGKLDQLEFLAAFNFQLDKKLKSQLDALRQEVEWSPTKRLRDMRDAFDRDITDYSSQIGCRMKPHRLVRFMNSQFGIERAFAYIPKFVLTQLFTKFRDFIPNWESYPAHALIGFDFTGQCDFHGTIEYLLPEAECYEDMGYAYNQAVLTSPEHLGKRLSKVENKAHYFYVRSATLSAFYFIEAYLNGIAFDFCYRTGDFSKLTIKQRELLCEWDAKRDREKWVSFRNKLLQYPKVILGLNAPPLTETNCEEIRVLAAEAKEIRGSLVHSSPRVELTPVGGKYQAIGRKVRSLMGLRLDDATKIVDSAVTLPKKINGMMGTRGYKLDWLIERDSTGMFPSEAFK